MRKKHSSSTHYNLNDETLDEVIDDSLDVIDDDGNVSNKYRDATVIESIDEHVMPKEKAQKGTQSRVKKSVILPNNGVFKHLSPVVKKRLLSVGRRIKYAPGMLLNSVGDPCQGLSFLLDGQVKVEWMDALSWIPIATLTPGDVFGAMEWAEGKLWEERLTAESEVLILMIPTVVLNPLSATYPDLQRQVERYTERHTLHALLGSNSMFRDISNDDIIHLIDVASLRYVDPGTVIFGPKMVLSLLFVIGRGEVELLCEDRVVQVLGRGEMANLELALGDGINMVTAKILSPTTLYVLPFDEIELLMAKSGRLYKLQKQAHLLRSRALND